MKTFTTYAEKKAKQFLNLLQGYTKGIRITAILILLLMGVNNAWAYTAHFSLMGDPVGNWNNDRDFMINTSTGTTDEWYIYAYVAKNQYFALNNGSSQYGPSNNGQAIKNGTGGGQGNYNTNSWKFTGTSGIIKICCAESQNREWYPWVWVEESAPTIKFKHPWNGGSSWSEQTATKQNDGTYTYDGKYGNKKAFNAGPSGKYKYNESQTTVEGSPATGDMCRFIWNPVGYVQGGAETKASGTFKIVKLCSLTYDGNGKTGGTVPSATNNQLYNTSITLSSETLTKAGYTHTGWNTKADGSGDHYDKGASYTLTAASTTLYAEWTPAEYTITYKDQGGSNFSGEHASGYPTTHTYGTATNLVGATKSGWDFLGWFTDSGCKDNRITSLGANAYTDNITLYAKWEKNEVYYTVTSGVIGSNGTLTVDPAQNKYLANTSITFTAEPNLGYEVEGWYSDDAGNNKIAEASNSYTITITADTEVYVKFKATPYNITYNGLNGASNSNKTTYTIEDTPITFADPGARNGYTFTGWNPEYIAQGSTGDKTTTANWTENQTIVTVTANNTTWGTLKFDSNAKDWGTTASVGVATTQSITATAAAGYKFVRWELSSEVQSSSNLTNATITIKGNGTAGTTGIAQAIFEEDLSSPWHLVGANPPFANGWNIDANGSKTRMMKKTGESTKSVAYMTVNVTALGTYEFKLAKDGVSEWFGWGTGGNSHTFSSTSTKDIYKNDANLKFKPSVIGSYEFKIDYTEATPYVTVTFPTSYKVTFSKGTGGKTITAKVDGVAINSGDNVLKGKNVVFTQEANTGYIFSKWTDGSGTQLSTAASYTASNLSAAITVKTVYTPQTCNVTLDQTDVTTASNPTSVTATYGTAMPKLTSIPLRTAYTFGGYYDEEGGQGAQYYKPDGTSAKNWDKTTDATLYARWIPTEYNITYELNEGTNHASNPKTYNITQEITLQNPTKAGHTFAGWYDNAEFEGNAVTHIEKGSTGDKTFYAKWDVASYTITFDQQGGAGGTASVTAEYGAKLPAITIPSRDGHLFDGYYTETGGTGTKYYNADGTTTKTMPYNVSKLYAKWIGYDDCIFFKNTLGWKNVYVYTFEADSWYEYEDGATKYGPGVCPKVNAIEFDEMTQIGKTDIFYYVLTKQTGFNYIAFSNAAMNTYDEFYGNKAIYRGDRSDQLQLFIPNATGSTKVVNQTKYYDDGIWMKYNSTYSGYDWSGKTANSDWSDHSLLAEKKGDYSFTTTVSLTAGTNYEFKISNVGKDADNAKIKETAWYGWSGTMTQANCTNKHFKHNTSNNAMITPTVDGDYTFTVYLGDGKVMVSLEYPLSTDDYRLAYNDITLSKIHEGHYLKKRTTGEILDTVSFFVRKDKTPQILLQQCTKIVDGKPTWETVDNGTYNITVNADGVYNFVLKQTNSGTHTATLETSATHKYTGDYYIRTDAAEGGWKSYRQASNRMNYSTYADSHSEFNHYFCSYREAGCNVKFIVANDYSECLTETMDNDDIIRPNQSSVGCLPAKANIRFGWDSETNQLSRAYISGAGLVEDRFLVLMGNEYLKDAEGKALVKGTNGSPRYGLNADEEIFDDMGNWIYQVDVQACNLTTIRLSALYNGQEQLFKGAKNDISLLNSTEPTYYKVRMIYDFKTNHMISAWLLDEQGNTIEGKGSLASDILVIRKNQDQANQLTFIEGAERTDVGVVYGVMTFDKFFLNNIDKKGNAVAQKDEKTIYERALYWISFPFNVKLKDIFGFSNYGDHWILEKYNGEARAENGAWVDSESYWEYITDSEYELEAGKGYVLCLDLDKMGVNSDVFQHTDEVSLYFPSKEKLGTINGATTSITLDPYTCIIERDNRNIYDSNWHLIGVPRFADITTENIDIYNPQPTQKDVGFYYEYGSNGEYTVKKSGATTFQTMSAYLVQYAGVINWTSTGITVPAAIAARKNSPAEPEQVHLRLEIAQDDEMADQTFVQLQQEGATAEFDMNLDLTKMLHSGTNIYTLAGEQGIKSAGNVMPMSECVVPVGVKVDAEGEYTFRMPDGTEGMVVELIDYYTNTRTNLLLSDYTVDLSAGTCNDRFALHIQPSKSGVTTNIDQINGGSMHHEGVQKYLIDGQLYIVREGVVYDAQGHRL